MSLLGKVIQLGFVVRDLEEGMDRIGRCYDLGPWTVRHIAPPELSDHVYKGGPGEFELRITLSSDAQGLGIELIEQTSGPSVFDEFLATRGEGLHHLGYERTLGFDETIEVFRKQGVQAPMFGRVGTTRFAYLDTEKLLGVWTKIFERKSDRF